MGCVGGGKNGLYVNQLLLSECRFVRSCDFPDEVIADTVRVHTYTYMFIYSISGQ